MNGMKRSFASLCALALVCALVLPAGAADSLGAFDLAAAGDRHVLAIKSDGSLWAWGANNMGQLGNGAAADLAVPVKIMDSVTMAAAGANHSLAVQSDGSLWTWGNNASGQLGLGSQDSDLHTIPVKVMDGVQQVAGGAAHSLAIKTDGSLWAWGANRSGQLGNGTSQDQSTPVKIMDDVAAVSAGEAHTLALKTDGTLWAWGANISGQLGADTQGRPDGDPMGNCLTPMQVMTGVTAVSASRAYSLALKADGTLWAWGDNQYGQLGNGGTGNMAVMQPGVGTLHCQTTPVQILSDVASVSAGGSSKACHALAVKTDGSLWGWGNDSYGQLGLASGKKASYPAKLAQDVQWAEAGGEYTLIIQGGSLLTQGNNSSGQLGNGTFQSSAITPAPTPTPTPTPQPSTPAEPTVSTAPSSTPAPTSSTPAPTATPPAQTSVEGTYSQTVTAYARTQAIDLDGSPVTFQAYALKDEKGYETNYVKLRDAAFAINGSTAQFQVNWNTAGISILTGQAYFSNGSEMHTPFSGDRQGKLGNTQVLVNGRSVTLSAILLTDDKGGGYTYFKLRDLGQALGFNVGWDKSAAQVYIQTDTPYTG